MVLVEAAPAPDDRLPLRRGKTRPVVLDRHDDLGSDPLRSDPDAAPAPLAGVVDHVAQHLVEILRIAGHRETVRNVDGERDHLVRMDAQQGEPQVGDMGGEVGPGPHVTAGRRRPRAAKMMADALVHALDEPCERAVTVGGGLRQRQRQGGERGLETVGEVGDLGLPAITSI